MTEKGRPGVMIYFDKIRPFLKKMNDEQAGALFRAILEYAEYGTIPELDFVSDLAFEVMQPVIDRDAEQYAKNSKKRQYATYCREAQRQGKQEMSYEAWESYYASDDIK